MDHVDRLVLESLFDRLPREIAFHPGHGLERLRQELARLRAAQREVDRIDPLADAFERAATAVLGQPMHQFHPLTVTANVEHEALAVPESDLADDRLDARIDRGGIGRVSAAEARTPQADPFRIDLRLRFEEADRVADIVDLFERNQAPLLAFAAAEAAIVEGQRDKARVDEGFRVVAENQRAQARKPVAKHNSRAPLPGL